MFGWFTSSSAGSGAIDVVAIRDTTGNISCSPFHVKLNRARKRGDPNRIVNLAVNGKDVSLSMKLGAAGEAFFVERTRERIIQSGSPAISLMGGSPTTVPIEPAMVTVEKEGNESVISLPKSPIPLCTEALSSAAMEASPTASVTAREKMVPKTPDVLDSLSISSDNRHRRRSVSDGPTMDATVAYLPLPLKFLEARSDRFSTPHAPITTSDAEKDDNSSELPRLIYLSAMESRTTLQSLASTQSLNSNATSVLNFETPTTEPPKSGIVPDSEGANFTDAMEGGDGKKSAGKSAISNTNGVTPLKLDDSSSSHKNNLQPPSPTSPSKRLRSFSDTFTSLAFSSPERTKLQQQLGQPEKGKLTPVNVLEKTEANATSEMGIQNPQTPPRKQTVVTIANSPEIVGAGITTTLPQDETVTTTDAPSSSVDASPMRKTIQSWSWTWGALPVKFRSSKSEPSLASKGTTPDPESALGQPLNTEMTTANTNSQGEGGTLAAGIEEETNVFSKTESLEASTMHTLGLDLDQDTLPSNTLTVPSTTAQSSPSVKQTDPSSPSGNVKAFGTVIPVDIDATADVDVDVDADVDITGDVDVSADAELNLSRHSQESDVSRVSIEVVETDTMTLEDDLIDKFPPPPPSVNATFNKGVDNGGSRVGTSGASGVSGKSAMMSTGPDSSSSFDPLGYHKAQPDILKDFVAGDPATYGDMWRWDSPDSAASIDLPDDILPDQTTIVLPVSLSQQMNATNKESQTKKIVQIAKDVTVTAQELSAFTPVVPMVGMETSTSHLTAQLSTVGGRTNFPNIGKNTITALTSTSLDIQECGSGSVRSNSLEGTGDGETDDERLSLQDIPMDEISPEPAGSDFYDSDTESFLSLSVEDGDTASVNSAGGSQREYGRKYRYRKVLVPSQEQLQSLQLLDGENEVAFDLPGCPPPLRTQLFVWPPDARIVIIDIEGAITAVQKGGLGWGGFLGGSSRISALHDGVIKLLNNIHKNGYRILYIAQTQTNSSGVAGYSTLSTKEHLAKVVAGLEGKLPPGPVIKSPDSLVRAFGAERTDVFKAAALRGLKGLFPPKHNPYYASFGTRACDMVAFARCGVPEGRIFLVNPETGEIRGGIVNRTLRTSYEQVNGLLHEMFPAVTDDFTRKPYGNRNHHAIAATATMVGGGIGDSRATSPSIIVSRINSSSQSDGLVTDTTTTTTTTTNHAITASAAFVMDPSISSSSTSIHSERPTSPLPPSSPDVATTIGTGMMNVSGVSSQASTTTAMTKLLMTATVAEDSYNDFNFWRLPIRSLDNTGL